MGPRRLPHPSFVVKGLRGSNSADYISLDSEQSEAITAQIENGITKVLKNSIGEMLPENTQPVLPACDSSTVVIKGKSAKPEEKV